MMMTTNSHSCDDDDVSRKVSFIKGDDDNDDDQFDCDGDGDGGDDDDDDEIPPNGPQVFPPL